MIEINANNSTKLEFALNIENTVHAPKNVRLILPIKEGVKLMIDGTVIEKSVIVTVPPVNNIIENGTDMLEGAFLEIVLNEQGQNVLFETAQERVKIIKPIKVAANLHPPETPQSQLEESVIEPEPIQEENIEPPSTIQTHRIRKKIKEPTLKPDTDILISESEFGILYDEF